jgi:RES domain-containing protein
MPAAPSREAHRVAGTCWRAVEGQHHVSTLALVASVAEQERLEQLIDATKPTVPVECRGLHYLLFTPFRYGPYPHGSRFRRAGHSPGVFYGAAEVETAIAELACCSTRNPRRRPGPGMPASILPFPCATAAPKPSI